MSFGLLCSSRHKQQLSVQVRKHSNNYKLFTSFTKYKNKFTYILREAKFNFYKNKFKEMFNSLKWKVMKGNERGCRFHKTWEW